MDVQVFGAIAGAIAVLVGAVVAINRLSGQGAESLGNAVHELSVAASEQVLLMRNDVQQARESAAKMRERVAVLETAVRKCEDDRDRLEDKIVAIQLAATAAAVKLEVDAGAAGTKLEVDAAAAAARLEKDAS